MRRLPRLQSKRNFAIEKGVEFGLYGHRENLGVFHN